MSEFVDTAKGLFSLEINTVLKAGMSAQKMPEVEDALVDLCQNYHIFLCQRARELGEPGQSLDGWALALSRSFGWGIEPFLQPDDSIRIVLEDIQVDGVSKPGEPRFGPDISYNADYLATPTHRIEVNFDRLREIASWMREMRAKTRKYAKDARAEIRMIAAGGIASRTLTDAEFASVKACAATLDVEDDSVLYRIQRTADQFKHVKVRDRESRDRGDPPASLDQQDLVKLRKAWDVGTEYVVMQTVLQIDGDAITRLVPWRAGAAHARLHELHAGAVDVSLRHWRTLADTIANMAGEVFSSLVGRR